MFTPNTPTPTYQTNYVSTHKRAKIVRLLLLVGVAFSLASLFFSALHWLVPSTVITDDTSDPVTIVLTLMEAGLVLMGIGVYIATIVFFLMWLYRSFENLPALGVPRGSIAYSSGWAVGSFFIPFVSLVVPYRAMKELWNKSVPNSGTMFSALSPPAFFPLWWTFWLLSNFASNAYLRLSFNDQLSPEVDAAFGAVTAVLSIVAALFAIKVVNEIEKQQIESSRLIPHHIVSPTPPPPELILNQPAQPQPGPQL